MAQYHDDPGRYLAAMRAVMPCYDEVQQALVAATAGGAATAVLDLGIGTGETARRVVAAHPGARVTGIDAAERMLALARAALPAARLLRRRLEDPLPAGPFDLVTAAFAVHHLDAAGKQDLFDRVRDVLRPGGRLAVGDVVRAERLPGSRRTPVDPAVDHPDTVQDQLAALRRAGFEDAEATWSRDDLAVFTATTPTRLFHVTPIADYDAAAPEHRPAAFAAEGFVHLCARGQLPGVLDRHYAGRDDLLVLAVDAAALPGVRWEPGAGGEPGSFPHLYAALPASAVRSVAPA